MGHLLLLRHGESEWNLDNRFVRWIDVPLSTQGHEEAITAAKQLTGYRFDRAFTSRFVRATETLRIVLTTIGQEHIPIEESQALTERQDGYLPRWNQTTTIKKPGAQQMERSQHSDKEHPTEGDDIQDTMARVLPYYAARIKPSLDQGETVLIVAHINSLLALVRHLDQLSPQQIVDLSIPTGALPVYGVDDKSEIVMVR